MAERGLAALPLPQLRARLGEARYRRPGGDGEPWDCGALLGAAGAGPGQGGQGRAGVPRASPHWPPSPEAPVARLGRGCRLAACSRALLPQTPGRTWYPRLCQLPGVREGASLAEPLCAGRGDGPQAPPPRQGWPLLPCHRPCWLSRSLARL